MPFEDVETISVRAVRNKRATISYMPRKTKTGNEVKPSLRTTIPKVIAGGFKPKAGQLFALKLGTGKDEGRARIVPAAKGVTPSLMLGTARFNFGYVPMLGDDHADRDYVDARAIDGGFEIDLPPWFKPDTA